MIRNIGDDSSVIARTLASLRGVFDEIPSTCQIRAAGFDFWGVPNGRGTIARRGLGPGCPSLEAPSLASPVATSTVTPASDVPAATVGTAPESVPTLAPLPDFDPSRDTHQSSGGRSLGDRRAAPRGVPVARQGP